MERQNDLGAKSLVPGTAFTKSVFNHYVMVVKQNVWDLYMINYFIDYFAPGSQSLHGVGAGIDGDLFLHHYFVCGRIQRCKSLT